MRASINGGLAVVAAALATAALLAGAEPATRIATVDAVQLATWIRDQKPGLRVIDLRSREDFDQYHVPAAEHFADAAASLQQLSADQTVVLYGVDEVRSACVPSSLQVDSMPGATRSPCIDMRPGSVYVLRDGLHAWMTDIMNPQLPAGASGEEEQAYQRKRSLAEYFGGQPVRLGEQGETQPTTEQSIRNLRRRGC